MSSIENNSGTKRVPFFILGCVRSGTTMLRDVLRLHPNLACPEETHFYRWAEPFGTESMRRTLQSNATLRHHRALDGITEDEFSKLLAHTRSRKDLYRQYMDLYIKRNKPAATRWFDKTPQNVYGAFIASSQFQYAKFIHIVRHPVNVAASLRLGKVMKVDNLIGSINYWNESILIIKSLKALHSKRVHELKYEDFTTNPKEQLTKILNFLKEPVDCIDFEQIKMRHVDHSNEDVLSEAEILEICTHCEFGMRKYGYSLPPGLVMPAEESDGGEEQ